MIHLSWMMEALYSTFLLSTTMDIYTEFTPLSLHSSIYSLLFWFDSLFLNTGSTCALVCYLFNLPIHMRIPLTTKRHSQNSDSIGDLKIYSMGCDLWANSISPHLLPFYSWNFQIIQMFFPLFCMLFRSQVSKRK